MYPNSIIEGLRSDKLRGPSTLSCRPASRVVESDIGTTDTELNRKQCLLLTAERKTYARVKCGY
jgi:hypothetical protein